MKSFFTKKKVVFSLSFFVVIIFITLMVVLFPANKLDTPAGGTNGVPSFALLANWTGTNGQVIKAITADESNIYAAAGYDGLLVFRISDMSNIGSFATNQPVNDVVLKVLSTNKLIMVPLGSYIGGGGILSLNVNDASNIFVTHACVDPSKNPQAIDYVLTKNGLKAVTADDSMGYQSYLIDGNGTSVTPEKPVPLGTKAAVDIAAMGTKVFIAAKDEGVFVVDTIGGNVIAHLKPALSLANSVFITGKTLVVADKMNGVLLYDVGNPSAPKLLATYNTPGDADDAWLVHDMLYIADGINGIIKVKWSQPDKFILQKIYNDGSIAYQLFITQDKKIFVACGNDGLKVLVETNEPAKIPPVSTNTNIGLTNAVMTSRPLTNILTVSNVPVTNARPTPAVPDRKRPFGDKRRNRTNR